MTNIEYDYYYDNWSTSPPSSLLRHHIIIGYDQVDQINVYFWKSYFPIRCHWLEENIGKINEAWHFTASIYTGNSRWTSTFYFKYIEDAMAFTLTWS